MRDYIKKCYEFCISYTYSLYHLVYLYITVFGQYFSRQNEGEAYDGEAYNG